MKIELNVHRGGGGVVLLYKRLVGMGRWMESHFHVWIDYNGVAFLMNFLNGVAHFRIFGERKFFTFTVSKLTRSECLYCR